MLVVIPLIYLIIPYTLVNLFAPFRVDDIAYFLQTFGRTLALPPRVSSYHPNPRQGAAGVHTSSRFPLIAGSYQRLEAERAMAMASE